MTDTTQFNSVSADLRMNDLSQARSPDFRLRCMSRPEAGPRPDWVWPPSYQVYESPKPKQGSPFTSPPCLVHLKIAISTLVGVKLKHWTSIGLLGLILSTCLSGGVAFASEDGGGRNGSRESSGGKPFTGGEESGSKESPGRGYDVDSRVTPTPASPSGPSPFNSPSSTKTKSAVSNDPQLALRRSAVKSPALNVDATKQAVIDGRAVSMTLLLTYLDQAKQGQVLDVKLHDAPEGLILSLIHI